MITASICTIGDEILIGQIVDTNSSNIAKALNAIGVKVQSMISIGDNHSEIIETLSNCLKNNNIVITTGGLGPTKDDITKRALAELTGARTFVRNQAQYNIMEAHLKARGIEISDINKDQASVPDNCIVLPNERGTAPNMEFVLDESKFGHKALLFSLPGVPFEAVAAIPKVVEAIKGEFNLERIIHRTICTFGIPESTLAKLIEPWEDALPKNLHLAYLPNPILGVRLRLSIYGTTEEEGNKLIDNQIEKLKDYIGNAIYGYSENSLQEAVGVMLKRMGKTVGTAESCTGGYVAHLLTSVSGSSGYFYGSIVSYHNSVKMNRLNVSKEILDKYGAVSRECVEQMARGAREALGTDFAVATSGIAGPLGGTPDKPVGTVWVAVADKESVVAEKFQFKASRATNIERFASSALDMLRRFLLERLP